MFVGVITFGRDFVFCILTSQYSCDGIHSILHLTDEESEALGLKRFAPSHTDSRRLHILQTLPSKRQMSICKSKSIPMSRKKLPNH